MSIFLEVDTLTAKTGSVTVGSSTVAQSKQWIEGTEAFLGLRFHGTDAATLAECWIMGEGPDAANVMRKLGVMSFRYADKDTTNGYMVGEMHVSHILAGVSTNEYQWAAWGKHGMAIFPPNILAANAPGPAVFRVHGSVDVLTNLDVASAIRGNRSSDMAEENLSLRNINAGTSAGTQIRLGHSASASAATITEFGPLHSVKPNTLEILNQSTGPVILGADGNEILRLYASGVALFQNLVGSEQVTLADAATVAVNWASGNNQYLASPAAGRTFTFAGARAGDHLTLQVLSAGVVTHTWPATIKWTGGGTVPVISASGKLDTFVFYYNGTSYVGGALLNA